MCLHSDTGKAVVSLHPTTFHIVRIDILFPSCENLRHSESTAQNNKSLMTCHTEFRLTPCLSTMSHTKSNSNWVRE